MSYRHLLLLLPTLLLFTACSSTQRWFSTSSSDTNQTGLFAVGETSVNLKQSQPDIASNQKSFTLGVGTAFGIVRGTLGVASSIEKATAKRRKVSDTISAISIATHQITKDDLEEELNYAYNITPIFKGDELSKLQSSNNSALRYNYSIKLKKDAKSIQLSAGNTPMKISNEKHLPVILRKNHSIVLHEVSIPISASLAITDEAGKRSIETTNLGDFKFYIYQDYSKKDMPIIYSSSKMNTLNYYVKEKSKLEGCTLFFGGSTVITNLSKSANDTYISSATEGLDAVEKLLAAFSDESD